MRRTCAAPGCGADISTRYGRYCQNHVAQMRRHGAIGQKGVTKADLKLHRGMAQVCIEKNRDKPLLALLEARWATVVAQADGIMTESQTGKPMVRHRRLAAYEVSRLGKAVSTTDIIETVLAMYLMQDQEPFRFKDDQGFRTQMVRRVRGLTTLNANTWFDPVTGKEKRVYRELPPRVTVIIGQWLAEAFGAAGIRFAQLERQEHESKLRELQEYHTVLGELE